MEATNVINENLLIEDFIFIANGHISALVNKLLNRAFRNANMALTVEQWTILCSLWQHDSQTQQSLCDNTFKEKASVTRLIDTLERNHYVARMAHPNDRRTNIIALTKRGTELEQHANQIVLEFIHQVIEDVDTQKLKMMKEIFLRMYHNLP